MRKLDAAVLTGLGGAVLGIYLLINSIGGAPQAASRPASTPAAKAQPAPITSAKPEEKTPVKQTAKAVAKPTVATALAQSLEQRCCENDACYHNIGPVTVEGQLDGKRLKQLIYASMAPSYTLEQGDELQFKLPSITAKQQAEGYNIKWVKSAILAKENIRYDMVAQHPAQERAFVGLYKGENLCASYPISVDIHAEYVSTSQSAPENTSAERSRRAPAPLPAPAIEHSRATPSELMNIHIVADPAVQPVAPQSGVTIRSAEGTVRYEDLPISKDSAQRVYTIPTPAVHRELLTTLPIQNRAVKDLLLWAPWSQMTYVAQK